MSSAVATRVKNLGNRAAQYDVVLDRTHTQNIATRLAAAPRTDFSSLGFITETGDGTRLENVSGPNAAQFAELVTQPAVRTVESIARDTADPVAVSLTGAGDAQFVVVWPVYGDAMPNTTAVRRATSRGWVVGATPLTSAIGPALTIFAPLKIGVSLSPVEAGPGPVNDVMAAAATVQVTHYPKQSQLPLVLIVALTVVLALAIAGLGIARRRVDREAAATDLTLRQQIKLISDISVTVQESLDVGLVLPAALTQIAQAHDLTYMNVVRGSGHEGRGHLLSIGHRPAGIPGPRWVQDSNQAAPGQLIRLPLQRASRTLGYVELVSPTGLDKSQLDSLRSTTDLLANALHNADLYEREQENVRRLRDLDEMKDDFLATVSHELRTPLSVLVGFMSLLARKWDRLSEDDRREAIMKSQAHVTSLGHLVNDLLDFVSERRTRNAVPEEIPLQGHVGSIVEQLRPLCDKQQLELHLDEQVLAWTDPRAVERIVGNLVSNAAKYSPAGTTITITAESRGEVAVVIVDDEGHGISPEEQQRIFERFYRGESDAARSTRGSGIGLAVVHEWLQAVGARLEIDSELGRGTRISVHFPTGPNQTLADAGKIRWAKAAIAVRSGSR